MHQPVDQGRCQGVVHVKEFAPFPKGTIRGDHDRSNFITGGDNLEQQIGPALVDGPIAQLIEEETDTTVAIFNGLGDRSMIVQAAHGHKGGTQAALSLEQVRQQSSDIGRLELVDYVQQVRGTDGELRRGAGSRRKQT